MSDSKTQTLIDRTVINNYKIVTACLIVWSSALKNKHRILQLKRSLKCFNSISILSRWALGPLGVRHCAQGHTDSRVELRLGPRAPHFQLHAFPAEVCCCPNALLHWNFFPLGTDESRRICGVVLSELNVPSANENKRLIRFHNHSLNY